jgi:tRNA G18 (ribose-2'-O)-methylase SpoU
MEGAPRQASGPRGRRTLLRGLSLSRALAKIMPLDRPLGATPKAVREALAPIRNDFSVALLSAGNAFAVGAIIRIAHSFLAREVILIGGGAWYAKASMGMDKYESILRIPELGTKGDAPAPRDPLATLREHVHGRPIWAVEKDHARRSLRAVEKFPPGVVFLFGSERFGIPKDVAEAADEVLGIPLYGVNHSLPLAVAAGIVMHEWAGRRYAPGAIT